jgi:type VI protein secretion system component VasF
MAASLVELCDPLFQYVCRLNRLARKGGLVDAGQVRSEFKSMLNEVKMRCEAIPGMGEQFAKVRLPLIYFIDFMVRDSALSFARSWKGIAEEEKQLGGDERFWTLLDETLADSGEMANQRLAVFYACVGLGFTGINVGQPDVLRKKMLEVSARIRAQMDADENSKITPEAYEKVNTEILQQPVASGVMTWVIILVGMTVLLVAGSWVGYKSAITRLNTTLTSIINGEPADSGAK